MEMKKKENKRTTPKRQIDTYTVHTRMDERKGRMHECIEQSRPRPGIERAWISPQQVNKS
jgi:hypothetical protein